MKFNEVFIETKYGQDISTLKLFYQITFNSSKNALFIYRLAQLLFVKEHKIIPLLLRRKLEKNYGLYISLNSKIGRGLKLPHVTSIVIGDGVEIGENVTIYQQVTLGGQNIGDNDLGNYPILGNDVIVYAGAKIIGKVIIGDGAVIGANSVVTKDVEPNSVYAGVPAKRIK